MRLSRASLGLVPPTDGALALRDTAEDLARVGAVTPGAAAAGVGAPAAGEAVAAGAAARAEGTHTATTGEAVTGVP